MGANVHWWLLKDEEALSSNSGYIESAGHVAALYQNELYDRATARAGTAMLQRFGILFGYRQVVLYVEPLADDLNMLTTNTARTTLLLNADKLPWDGWAYEFRSKMPKQLADFVNEKAAGSGKDHTLNIRDRLKSVMDLFRVSRYRPAPTGVYVSDDASIVSVGQSSSSDGGAEWAGKLGSDGGSVRKAKIEGENGNIYHLFEKKGGITSGKVSTDPFPKVIWASKKNGLRTADDGMEDKAATFVRSQNTLLINTDFRVFTDMIRGRYKITDLSWKIKPLKLHIIIFCGSVVTL